MLEIDVRALYRQQTESILEYCMQKEEADYSDSVFKQLYRLIHLRYEFMGKEETPSLYATKFSIMKHLQQSGEELIANRYQEEDLFELFMGEREVFGGIKR